MFSLLFTSLLLRANDVPLTGLWRMKDFSKGVGVHLGIHLPKGSRLGFMPVTVPTTERAALLKAGEILDPYVGTNALDTLWTEEKEWWFVKEFTLDATHKGKTIDLIFEGIVYKGEVWLNGKALGAMEGMFNPFAFPVSSDLNYGGKNVIAVRLEAPKDAVQRNLSFGYQYDLTPERPQLHAISQSLYCWDWAPHMVVTGIWRPVKLRVTNFLRVDQPWVRTTLRPEGGARLDVQVETTNLSAQTAESTLVGNIRPKNFKGDPVRVEKHFSVAAKGSTTSHFTIDLKDVRLWWPNGMGDQNLYTFDVKVMSSMGISDQASTSFGIRELKIIPNENTDEFLKAMKESIAKPVALTNDLIAVQSQGKVVGAYPWTFQVNGRKMFAKGSNWVPIDQMLRLDRARYDHLLTLAKDAHFNLLRVWGGGLFETEDFYELCDEKGILNWFEFLSSSDFSKLDRDIFTRASRATLRRIRNHPSLTYYCGGNEFDPDASGIKDLIDRLGRVVQEEDPDREFHRASPYMGDDHFWGVWHRFAPYTDYRRVRPFRSEAGLNAMPVVENYRKFTPPDKLWPMDKHWLEFRGSYQVNFSHMPKQDRYANEFGPSSSIDQYIRHSQLAQALANSFNIEFCRSKKFQNSGVLIWQFNDAYPCASWSMVDWYGTPKSGYYASRRASRPVHVAADFETYLWKPEQTFRTELSLLNDLDQAQQNLKVESTLLSVQGRVLDHQEVVADIAANTSRAVLTHRWAIPMDFEGRTFLLAVRLKDASGRMISDLHYPMAVRTTTPVVPTSEQAKDRGFNKFRHFENALDELQKLPIVSPTLTAETMPGRPSVFRVTLSNPGSALLFDARLRLEGEDEVLTATYSDNYVSLLPGESRTIIVKVAPKRSEPLKPVILKVQAWNGLASLKLQFR
ncbi:sugar-binding domain-containing protein [Geothrix sp. PMB-07]|uniref:glycoside hydrolase family 2 protein n=1 Tax=Geothrix sp. PMB-07 TaxID=3068640 RepID=UPI00274271AD|nr:sugar-binding domain-containing protein [Geothrix sp. PMB-07]WLT30908.1 hypothetical protein Q9293_14405 [Geothrix sp. PMB-07]